MSHIMEKDLWTPKIPLVGRIKLSAFSFGASPHTDQSASEPQQYKYEDAVFPPCIMGETEVLSSAHLIGAFAGVAANILCQL